MEAGELVQRLNLRIRGEAHSDAFMLDILSRCQQAANMAVEDIISVSALVTQPYLQVYNLRSLLPDFGKLLAVQVEGRDLDLLRDWNELARRNQHWFRQLGPDFESCTMVGRSHLIIHPAQETVSEVNVIYTKLTIPFENGLSEVEVYENTAPLVIDMAEVFCLLRERRYESMPAVLDRIGRIVGVPSAKG